LTSVTKYKNTKTILVAILWLLALQLFGCQSNNKDKIMLDNPIPVSQSRQSVSKVNPSFSGVYRLQAEVVVEGNYAVLDIYAGGTVLANNINLPKSGKNRFNVLIDFDATNNQPISFRVKDSDIRITTMTLTLISDMDLPRFHDISNQIGLDKANSIKYGGPTVADMDMDGDYDFIVNNHNAETSKLYWNNGDGTVTKHLKNLARWFMHDLHGTAAGDYDNDGDLDLVVTMGGGNGTNPSKANFYLNDNGNFVLYTGDVGIDKGGRGRGARWLDADLDGDLDLLLHNEASLSQSKPQQYFYKNLGNGKFNRVDVGGVQDVTSSRVLVTDLNDDQIEDIIFYGHHSLSVWQGNGDFTFTDVTKQLPEKVTGFEDVMAMVDVDIDNDGDSDLYLARGKEFGIGDNVSMDFDALTSQLDLKPKGQAGKEKLILTSAADIKLFNYHYQARLGFRNKIYPIFLGQNKILREITQGQELVIKPEQAQGFPADISKNGMYYGVTGKDENGQFIWQVALVRNQDVFWGFGFSLLGVSSVRPEFELENRNVTDVLLENRNGHFVDVSDKWNVPTGNNSLGVTRGDFNNDGRQDLLVYRWGRIGNRAADLMLLNNNNKSFESFTQHGASDIGGPGNGDMGQVFDFDLDGKLDILSGSEGGQWYLYKNNTETNKYLTVRVNYSPVSNIDPYNTVVEVTTDKGILQQRIGSSGEVFSQSLLNNVHFGLADAKDIKTVTVKWRNGERYQFDKIKINSLIETPITDWFKQTKQAAPLVDDIDKVKPFIQFEGHEKLTTEGLQSGSEITLRAKFHAGSGNKVIAADEGGIRFWLRHFRYKWIPANDITLVDETPLYNESGTATVTLSLAGIKPSDDLPEGHFYQLRASFMNSNGEMIDTKIDNIKVK
jgi:hypothetical protein